MRKYLFNIADMMLGAQGFAFIEFLHYIPFESYVKMFWQSLIGITTFTLLLINNKNKKENGSK